MEKDMQILREMTNEQLAVPVAIMLDKGWITEMLSADSDFRACHKAGNYHSCIELIASEIRKFGGNSFINFFRGEGPSYKEIACDVCEELGVKVDPTGSMEQIDLALLEKVLSKVLDRMDDDSVRKLLSSLKIRITTGSNFKAEALAAMILAFRAGGFASYELTMIIVNSVAKAILGRGLSLAANATINKALGIATGPVGIALTAIWTAVDITGPAYRVTIPIVIYLAGMRQIHRNAFAMEDQGETA